MRTLAAFAAVALAAAEVNINFNSCSGDTTVAGCNVKQVTRFVQIDSPVLDVINSTSGGTTGFASRVFHALCRTQAFRGVRCSEVVDSWGNVWNPDTQTPGPGLLVNGFYDMALLPVTTSRGNSLLFSDMVMFRPDFMFLASDTKALNTFFHNGYQERFIVMCDMSDDAKRRLREQFPEKGQFLFETGDCAETLNDLKEALTGQSPAATVAVLSRERFNQVEEAQLLDNAGLHTLPRAAMNEQHKLTSPEAEVLMYGHFRVFDAVAFAFPKTAVCEQQLVNKGLEELRTSGELQRLCEAEPLLSGIGRLNCYTTRKTYEMVLQESMERAAEIIERFLPMP